MQIIAALIYLLPMMGQAHVTLQYHDIPDISTRLLVLLNIGSLGKGTWVTKGDMFSKTPFCF